jgi:hypothetical protein
MHAPQPLEQLLSFGEIINQIPVDHYGMCRWVDVANVELALRQRSLDTIFEMQSRIDVLEEALRYISKRKVMDGVSAISMRAVATAALKGVLSS